MSNLSLLLSQSTQASADVERRRLEHVRAGRGTAAMAPETPKPIAVRMLGPTDQLALERLAGLDSASVPAGRVLGAEVEGRLVAAISLSNASLISDPFRLSGSAVELLKLRARQLRAPRRGLSRLRRRHRAHARGALAGSPPGAGGRLLRL